MSLYKNLFKRAPKDVRRLVFTISVLAVVLIAVSILALHELQNYKDSHLSPDEKVRQITAEVGKRVVLPTNEIPTVATISDPSKLPNQDFFREAKTGDQILLFSDAKKVVLWRPSVQKVVGISSLTTQ